MKLNRQNHSGGKKHPERIIQFGEGNFLRAFVDWIINEMNEKVGFDSSAVVIQPLPSGRIDMLNEQDGLYTLYLNGIQNGEVRSDHQVIHSISRGINPYTQYEDYLALAENPDMRFIISNTTEAGIAFDEKDTLEGMVQNSFPGKLTALLYRRYQFFNGDKEKGFILMPCELIDRNGEELKRMILRYANHWDLEKGFADWIDEANVFCNTLVDRIVPGYPKDKIVQIYEELGYEDQLVVEGEQFHLWVIEGPQWIKKEFPADKAGLNVLFVEDMTPYRTRKVRILNGAHTSMVPVAYLYGLDTVRETVEHPVLGRFVKEVVFDEIIPTLDLSQEELEQFANDVLDRFRNPFIKHLLISISLNSMSKYETRVLPTLLEYKKRKNQLPSKIVFALASMIVFYKGKRNQEIIPIKDSEDIIQLYKEAWDMNEGSEESLEKVVRTVLSYEQNWKMDLTSIPGLVEEVTKYVNLIEKEGMEKALEEVM
ncbi:MAG: tagaturonate reductase [Epulopiscium sp.]|nr:tagaturonate reductase [Candidatus Epulonipiscium sp.]